MLVSVSIKNFAIVRQLEVNWHNAMTTITGETGAGKSIAIDALSLALGERADAGVVRTGSDKAEVIASFDVTHLVAAKNWLSSQDLLADNECILRRVISKEGRSKAYINGTPVPASQLKSIGSMLVSIHGQHAHTQLSKPDYQRTLLDEFGGHLNLVQAVEKAFKDWQSTCKELDDLSKLEQENSATKQLLEYQVSELSEADISDNEFEQIEAEHKRLHNATSLLSDSQQIIDVLYDNEQSNAYSALQLAISKLADAAAIDKQLDSTVELINNAVIQVEEGVSELRQYAESLEVNPQLLEEVESRLSQLVDLSRKHKVDPNELPALYDQLSKQLNSLEFTSERLESLKALKVEQEQAYFKAAEMLSNARKKSADKLSKDISLSMQDLNMSGAKFNLKITRSESTISKHGIDTVEFLVSANLGQMLQPLSKVASGGELSRISLAIQVIIAEKCTTPTLLFDEVDVGVSGPTATAVGRLMKRLSKQTQVICVTHLPQVACFGHQQHFVHKKTLDKVTETYMNVLDEKGRIEELARLLGGEIISDKTKANAQELLNTACAV